MIDHFGFAVTDLDRRAEFALGVFSPFGLREATRISHPFEAVTHADPID